MSNTSTDINEHKCNIDDRNLALSQIVDSSKYELTLPSFQANCKRELDQEGVLVLPGFLTEQAVSNVVAEAKAHEHLAYYTASDHNVYLMPTDAQLPLDHPRNRLVSSSKGCITDDQIPEDSVLRELYNSDAVRHFLCRVLGEEKLHEYADPLSSINLHYASHGQELGWHFDNSSFAITLLIQKTDAGGVFEYVKDVRDADAGEANYTDTNRILNSEMQTSKLSMEPGTLVLFRGRNSLHRVTPTIGDTTRLLVVLAYNTEPGIALSESARKTFYGRLC